MIQIGKLKIDAGAPIAERLHTLASCTIAEMRAMLAGTCIAGTVAKALLACTEAEHEVHGLAEKIAAAGLSEIRAAVHALYAEAEGDNDAEVQA